MLDVLIHAGGQPQTAFQSSPLQNNAAVRSRHALPKTVHAHPPAATGFAVAGRAPCDNVLAELVATFGAVPLVPYAAPGSAGERTVAF